MWVNAKLFQRVLDDNKAQMDQLQVVHRANDVLVGEHLAIKAQKAKDDVSIDWLRHRVNALEKQNAVLLQKATGVHLPVPEIVPTRPGTISDRPDFDFMPSFEDVGEAEAKRLGVEHDDFGVVQYTR